MAATVRFRIVLDAAGLDRLKRATTSQTASKAALATRNRVRANIRAKGRVRTGAMVDSVVHRKIREDADGAVFSVSSDLPYTPFQERGIGPVHAAPGRVLAFVPKGSAVVIFRPRTRGFPGGHFFRDALDSLGLSDFV